MFGLYKKLTGFLLIFTALAVMFVDMFSLLTPLSITLFAILFIGWGVVGVTLTTNSSEKLIVFVSGVLVIAGVIILVLANFTFKNAYLIEVPSIIVSFGAGFFMVYTKDKKEKIFGIISIIAIITGFLLTTVLRETTAFNLISNMVYELGFSVPLLGFFLGVAILANRDNPEI